MMATRSSLMLYISRNIKLHKEHEPTSLPGRRPPASCQVAAVVLGGHDRRLQILIPDARRPVTDGQEILGVEGIPYQAVHWTMVPCHCNTDSYTLQTMHLEVPPCFSTAQRVDWELCKSCCDCMILQCHGQFCTGIIGWQP